jgi:type I restriction enzyme S subunit
MSWQTVHLEEIVSFTNGGAWKQSEYTASGIPVVRVSDIQNGSINLDECKYLPVASLKKYEKHLLNKGDLVICTVGSHPTQPNSVVGRTAIVQKNAHKTLLNQNAVRLAPINSNIDNLWLGYFGKSKHLRDYIISHARGAANQVRMSISELKKMPLELPPFEVQQRIGAILSTYDALIDNNLQRIKILEEMAQIIYREWFIDFRFPNHEKSKMVGFLPQEWNIKCILDIDYWDFISSNIRPFKGEKVYYATANIDGIDIIRDGELTTYTDKPSRAQKEPTLYSVWFARMKETYKVLGFTEVNVDIAQNSILSSGFAGFESIKDIYPFLYFTIKSASFHQIKDLHCTGATQMALTNKGLSSIKILEPNIDIVIKFGKLASPIVDEIFILQKKNNLLRQTRDLLLPTLISGELDVENLDIRVPEEAN